MADRAAGIDHVRHIALAILVRRRDALRSALAGDLSLLRELRSESPGDVIDAAYDSAQDEISSQLAEVESRELDPLSAVREIMEEVFRLGGTDDR